MTPATPKPGQSFSPAAYVAAIAVGLATAGIEIGLFLATGQIVLPKGGLIVLIGVFLAFPAALITFLPGAAVVYLLAGKLQRFSLAYYAASGALVAATTVLAITALGGFEATLPSMLFALFAVIPGMVAGLTYRAVERRTPLPHRRVSDQVGGVS